GFAALTPGLVIPTKKVGFRPTLATTRVALRTFGVMSAQPTSGPSCCRTSKLALTKTPSSRPVLAQSNPPPKPGQPNGLAHRRRSPNFLRRYAPVVEPE